MDAYNRVLRYTDTGSKANPCHPEGAVAKLRSESDPSVAVTVNADSRTDGYGHAFQSKGMAPGVEFAPTLASAALANPGAMADKGRRRPIRPRSRIEPKSLGLSYKFVRHVASPLHFIVGNRFRIRAVLTRTGKIRTDRGYLFKVVQSIHNVLVGCRTH